MERSEPALVPEWLKNTGSSGGASISQWDDHAASVIARNKLVNNNGHDIGRPSSSDRTTSAYFRRSSSSNGSNHLRSYSGSGRQQRERDWEKDAYDSHDKDKLVLNDRRHRYFSDPFTWSSKYEGDKLKRSQSMVSGKREDTWPRKVVNDSSSASGNNNGMLTKSRVSSPVGGVKKATFDRDFPSLGSEERVAVPEVVRVASPGLSSAIQNLPIGTSVAIGGEKWTSALAEVPVVVGSNGSAISSLQQSGPSTSTSVSLGSTASLNMAEAVALGPSRAKTAPQLSVGTQRLEELAIKQSKQLIPVTPSMPKASILTPDKQKMKLGQHQHPISSSLPVSHSPRGAPLKADVAKVPNLGKLHILKPVRDKNGASPVAKETSSPNNGNNSVNSPSALSGPTATRGPANNPVLDRKPVLTVLEKRPTTQARSRNDFFNLVRKKSMGNSSSIADSATANSSSVAESGSVVSPSFSDKPSGTEDVVVPNTSHACDTKASPNADNLSERGDVTCNGVAHNFGSTGKKTSCSTPIFPEEEEAAFLRSLGWEENSDESGLTEEEISDFYKDMTKYINSNSSLKILQGVHPKLSSLFDSQNPGIDSISSGFSSSDAKLES